MSTQKGKAPERELTNNIEMTSIRVPSAFYNDIKNIADEMGNSINGTMLMLMKFGMKLYNAKFDVTLKEL